jgi:hypothetical protein
VTITGPADLGGWRRRAPVPPKNIAGNSQLLLWRLSKEHAWPTTVLVDELDAGGFNSSALACLGGNGSICRRDACLPRQHRRNDLSTVRGDSMPVAKEYYARIGMFSESGRIGIQAFWSPEFSPRKSKSSRSHLLAEPDAPRTPVGFRPWGWSSREIGFVSQKTSPARPQRFCFDGFRRRTPGPPPLSSPHPRWALSVAPPLPLPMRPGIKRI